MQRTIKRYTPSRLAAVYLPNPTFSLSSMKERPKEDLAASIFQAVVNQTISGLACGKPIRGHVAFLGGPLHFLSELRETFIRTLKIR